MREGGPSFEDSIVLNQRIKMCSSAEEVQKIVQNHVDDLTHVNVATALHTLGRLAKHDGNARRTKQTVTVLVERALDTAEAFKPQEVSTTLLALAKMRITGEMALVRAMAKRGRKMAGSFNPQNISNTLWALATLGVTGEMELVRALAKRGQNISTVFKPQEVTNTLWALAKMGVTGEMGLVRALAKLGQDTA